MNLLPPPTEASLILIEILCFISGAVLGAIWGLLHAEKPLHKKGNHNERIG